MKVGHFNCIFFLLAAIAICVCSKMVWGFIPTIVAHLCGVILAFGLLFGVLMVLSNMDKKINDI